MKNRKYINFCSVAIFSFGMAILSSCEREFSDDVEFETFSTNGDIFTDSPVGITDEFFESFDPAVGANPNGFGTDDDVAFQGQSRSNEERALRSVSLLRKKNGTCSTRNSTSLRHLA